MAIIVGDIHGDIEKARAFLAYQPESEHVAVGDYLDSFTVPFQEQVECLNLLMDSDAVLLLGNHECHYLKKPIFQFAGYQLDHAAELQDILEYNLDRFKVAHVADGWLCTHAGVMSRYTKRHNDVAVLADMFNNDWKRYLEQRMVIKNAHYAHHSIFEFNYFLYVDGNLLPQNTTQVFGHVESFRPIVETNYVALDSTNHSNSCWMWDTETCQLVQIPMSEKIGRVRFKGVGWI